MASVVLCLSTAMSGLVLRRDPTTGLSAPILKAAPILSIPVVLVVLSTELTFIQYALLTPPLTGPQWLACLGLALITPVVVELDTWIRRRRAMAPAIDVSTVVNPRRTAPAPVAVAGRISSPAADHVKPDDVEPVRGAQR